MGFNGKIIKAEIHKNIYDDDNIYIEMKNYQLKIVRNYLDFLYGRLSLFDCIVEQLLCELYFERKFKNGNS